MRATSPGPPTPPAGRSRPSARPSPVLEKPFVIASGILGVLRVPNGVVATERDGLAVDAANRQSPIPGGERRMANADFTLALAERGVRSSVVRLPPSTHGNGDNGFIPTAVAFARQKGAAAYVGAGTNRWPTVHRDDAARLFRLALESAPAGSVLHAVGEHGVPIREVAEVLRRGSRHPRRLRGPGTGRRIRPLSRWLLGSGRPRFGTDHA